MDLIVRNSPIGPVMDWGQGPRRCAVGSAGIGPKLREGDGFTPTGTYALRNLYWRADKLSKPLCILPGRALARDDGWCDAPDDPHYNQLIKHPYPASAEHLWRDDNLYDLIAVVGFNDQPVTPGRGSAIFLHVAHDGYTHTAGCVALTRHDLLAALAQLKTGDRVRIG